MAEQEADVGRLIVESNLCKERRLHLEKCRRKAMYLPWRCGEEKHSYNMCEKDVLMMVYKLVPSLQAENAGKPSER